MVHSRYLNIYIPKQFVNDTIKISNDGKFILNNNNEILYGLNMKRMHYILEITP